MYDVRNDATAKAGRYFVKKNFGINEPATIIVLPLEGQPIISNAIRSSDDAERLHDWLTSDRQLGAAYKAVLDSRQETKKAA